MRLNCTLSFFKLLREMRRGGRRGGKEREKRREEGERERERERSSDTVSEMSTPLFAKTLLIHAERLAETAGVANPYNTCRETSGDCRGGQPL